MIRLHTYHITSSAVSWLIQYYGHEQTCKIVKDLVWQAGLDPMQSDWQAGAGRGITVRGLVFDPVEA